MAKIIPQGKLKKNLVPSTCQIDEGRGLVGGDQIIYMKNFADTTDIFYNSPERGIILNTL